MQYDILKQLKIWLYITVIIHPYIPSGSCYPFFCYNRNIHYGDFIIGAMVSQITNFTIVYSTVYSGTYQKKKLRVTGLCERNSPAVGVFPAQMASNAENIFIWWRHHGWINRSTLWLTMPWHLTSPGHYQPYHWIRTKMDPYLLRRTIWLDQAGCE